MAKVKTQHVCQACGYASAKWLGRCPECGGWNTFAEERSQSATQPAGALSTRGGAVAIDSVRTDDSPRLVSGLGELDRVLGGGLVPGALVLVGGDPGIGKSTLLLQALVGLCRAGHRVLYVSGEESVQQTGLRAQRLGALHPELKVLAETELERILEEADQLRPAVLAVDSVQTIASRALDSIPGSVGQVRETAGRLLSYAKTTHVPVLLVGHVTKDGALAGPKTLEHVVDTVLYFEGERSSSHRLLRAQKNRFGSTDELGVFEMRGEGLVEVDNPSEVFLAERSVNAPGSVVTAGIEGSRPLLVEVQALVAGAAGMPRRAAVGVDPNRVALLIAVLERRAGVDLLGQDVFVNLAGGLRLTEPAVDLAVVAALASSARGRPIAARTVCFGEVGLTGEVRSVGRADLRVAEAARLGFSRVVLPESSRASLKGKPPGGVEIVGVRDVASALEALG